MTQMASRLKRKETGDNHSSGSLKLVPKSTFGNIWPCLVEGFFSLCFRITLRKSNRLPHLLSLWKKQCINYSLSLGQSEKMKQSEAYLLKPALLSFILQAKWCLSTYLHKPEEGLKALVMWTFKSACFPFIKPTQITSQNLLKAILSPFEKSRPHSSSLRHSLQKLCLLPTW